MVKVGEHITLDIIGTKREYSHIKRIRKKFKKVDEKFSSIETRYGSGYRWNVG